MNRDIPPLYLQARQRSDGHWEYCAIVRSAYGKEWTFPVGYCAGDIQMLPNALAHVTGHASAKEAERCYFHYTLDHLTHYAQCDDEYEAGCAVCGALTHLYVTVGADYEFFLCDVHQTREAVSDVLDGLIKAWECTE